MAQGKTVRLCRGIPNLSEKAHQKTGNFVHYLYPKPIIPFATPEELLELELELLDELLEELELL